MSSEEISISPEEISMSRIQFLGTTEQFKDKLWPWSLRNTFWKVKKEGWLFPHQFLPVYHHQISEEVYKHVILIYSWQNHKICRSWGFHK